jgi:hypothetical protein
METKTYTLKSGLEIVSTKQPAGNWLAEPVGRPEMTEPEWEEFCALVLAENLRKSFSRPA